MQYSWWWLLRSNYQIIYICKVLTNIDLFKEENKNFISGCHEKRKTILIYLRLSLFSFFRFCFLHTHTDKKKKNSIHVQRRKKKEKRCWNKRVWKNTTKKKKKKRILYILFFAKKITEHKHTCKVQLNQRYYTINRAAQNTAA